MTFIEEYMQIKNQYPDSVTLFGMGQFYQLYYHDALMGQKILGLRLQKRSIGGRVYIPMCGLPVTCLEKYTRQLSEAGYRVVVCDQSRENGELTRNITQIVEPVGEKIDLSEEWARYLRENRFEPSPRQHRTVSEGNYADRIRQLDTANMTPMQALALLSRWKEELEK